MSQLRTKVLLFSIRDVKYPVTVDTIKKVCHFENVEIQRLAIFHKNGLQAFVEFKSPNEANFVQQELNDCDIYPGCCTLKIEFSPAENIDVRINSDVSYNIDIGKAIFRKEDVGTRDSERIDLQRRKEEKLQAMLTRTRGLPTVQNILKHVMTEGSMNGNPPPPALMSINMSPPWTKCDVLNKPNQVEQNTVNNRYKWHSSDVLNKADHMGPKEGNEVEQNNVNNIIDLTEEELNCSGGEGCVTMVFGLNNEKVSCDHLFNLFCCFGNVVKIKVLPKKNKPSGGMVQFTDRLSTELSIEHLNKQTLFGHLFEVSMSKHSLIPDTARVATLYDGSQAIKSYSQSPNNRFKFIPGGNNDLFSRIYKPTKVLHYSNAPPDCTEVNLLLLFETFKAEIPVKHKAISTFDTVSCSGFLQFSSISNAVEALTLVNHVTLRKGQMYIAETFTNSIEKGGVEFSFKLDFSTIQSIT